MLFSLKSGMLSKDINETFHNSRFRKCDKTVPVDFNINLKKKRYNFFLKIEAVNTRIMCLNVV